jgi:hypothetical protein
MYNISMIKNIRFFLYPLLIIIFLSVAFAYSLKFNVSPKPASSQTDGQRKLIGGQKDEHGCLIPAGYSWCDFKQKCLRTWEETCGDTSDTDKSDWTLYRNATFGFELKFPKTWEGYKAYEGVFSSYSGVSFGFGGKQPFILFQLIKRTKEQLKGLGKNTSQDVLYESETGNITCDGCCDENGDFTGGGQFNAFQIARCMEVPKILKTFKTIN